MIDRLLPSMHPVVKVRLRQLLDVLHSLLAQRGYGVGDLSRGPATGDGITLDVNPGNLLVGGNIDMSHCVRFSIVFDSQPDRLRVIYIMLGFPHRVRYGLTVLWVDILWIPTRNPQGFAIGGKQGQNYVRRVV